MTKKRNYGKTNVIISHDRYEFNIRSLKRAIDILENERDADRFNDERNEGEEVYPLHLAIGLLNERLWKEFEEMCCQKAEYENGEFTALYNQHKARRDKEYATQGQGQTQRKGE